VLGLDDRIAALAGHGGLALALAIAVLLGLRHATDPDHLTAVSTLVVSEERQGSRRAGLLGLAWGAGHAVTLFALGLPVVLLGSGLPESAQRAAELAVGVVIVALAVRLLVRWRRGYLHVHVHSHGEVRHAHPHVHEERGEHAHAHHDHGHAEALGRSPAAAFGIGLLHGAGGSAGAGVVVVAAVSARAGAVIALALFAAATACSMAICSTAFGAALTRPPVARRFAALAPALGTLGLLFGTWYALAALQSVAYPL
jgi:ABC-type nickel/cobalt efflux system permease component RcnA